MSYSTARQCFESAKGQPTEEAVRKIAEGLLELSRSIEQQLKNIEAEVGSRR